ncbi:hypothetical protein BJY04DRAFT_213398 [Aspergillus karnatakaensis]|uniref:phosphotransferase family protein n=1 Tax=Aspergillus karnatakaensis TaxID=1810916 RepID=UPI003CCE2AF4
MWSCDFDNCGQPSVPKDGDCIICDRHLCATHLNQDHHDCPQWEDGEAYDSAAQDAERKEITTLLNNIKVDALLSRASHLREGVPCFLARNLRYDHSTRSSVMGGMNYHIEIHFQDDVVWLARIRRCNATSPPLDMQRYIMRSEVATLQFLSRTNVPAPKVFDYDLDGGLVGVGYILMEKLPGKSLRWSLATKASFSQMGSLDQPGTNHVGPFAREALTDYHQSRMQPIGPFTSPYKYLLASIQLTLDLIVRGESYASRPIDAYLVHRFLLDSVPQILSHYASEDGHFYLKHADDKGDHVLVDNEYNITGIIDWEWAHTDSKSVAFNSPILLLPVAEFYAGSFQPGKEEQEFAQILDGKEHRDLAEIVRQGRIIHLFNFCCGYDLADWDGFVGLFQGLRRALNAHGELGWEAWREKAMRDYEDDARLNELIRRQGGGKELFDIWKKTTLLVYLLTTVNSLSWPAATSFSSEIYGLSSSPLFQRNKLTENEKQRVAIRALWPSRKVSVPEFGKGLMGYILKFL